MTSNYERAVQVLDPAAQNALGVLDWPPYRGEHPDDIANKAMAVAEDLCIMQVSDLRLVAACVCAPSYWRLTDKIGRPIDAIHAPVDGLNAASGERVAHTLRHLPLRRGFVRDNWLVHGDHALAHFERETRLESPVDTWVMRCERQTLYRLTEAHLLFAIRIRSADLSAIAAHRESMQALCRALQQMDTRQIAYFGGQAKHQHLLAWLEEQLAREA
ncbi:MAG: heme-dependent oxidative N-demethylase subunit alpha family protein [Pseudomonadota bacterium]